VNGLENYIIEGGNRLEGIVEVSGSKNAALPIIAASILNDGKVSIEGCPDIHDVIIMSDILKNLGCDVKREKDIITIDASNIIKYEIPEDLMREMRSSVINVGALIGRLGKCKFSYPGGCEIGARPINLHLDAFRQLGVKIVEEYGYIYCECDKLKGTDITLDFPSVGATENIMLASCLASGITHVRNVAREPEIKDLQDFLNSMGAKINGAGSNVITIKGVDSLHNTKHKVIPDRIEAGTYLCNAVATKGEIELLNVVPEHINSIIHKLKQTDCIVNVKKESIYLKSPKILKAIDIKTMPYPGFPTDMQSQFVAMLSTANGTSVVIENIFENRFKYISELIRMGAKILIEGRTAVVKGVNKLLRS
jgi:UDP-N-acetylglucosamine 1-carboxyvinyltransferase